MNLASVGLALLAGLVMLILTVAGVVFVAQAAYLALATQLSPWLAALLTGSVLLLPFLAGTGILLWRSRQRRLQRRRGGLAALQAILAESAKTDPYGFVGTAFVSGMMLSASRGGKERVAEFSAIFESLRPGG